MTLGQKIKQKREEKNMLQRELASLLNIGDGFLSKVEHDQKILKREDLDKLSKLFEMQIEELESLWLANKVCTLIRNEQTALLALKAAEKQLIYYHEK